MEIRKLNSSAISAAGYDEQSKTLRIWFTSDPRKAYDYYGVPPQVWQGLITAQSAGRYFHLAIEDTYSSNR